ncbi:MAG: SDR family oxidoreductase [Roseiarcus sp.]
MTEQKVAVVTGASRGIGFSIAKRLGERGMHVILISKYDQVLDSASRLAAEGVSAEALIGDASDESSVRSLVAKIDSTHRRCDVLVNNAGISPKHDGRKLETIATQLSEWNLVLRVNLTGPFLMCRECLPLMERNQWGRIVSISSLAGRTGSRHPASIYCATKAGLIGFSRVLAEQVGKLGITVNCVAAGKIATAMATEWSQAHTDAYAASVPLGRLGVPDDVAGAVEFLASEDAAFITGAVVDVNGGMFMN